MMTREYVNTCGTLDKKAIVKLLLGWTVLFDCELTHHNGMP